MKQVENKGRKVVHLQMGDVHEYYGSLANLFEFHNAEQIGISYGGLRNYGITADKPYSNSRCVIRVGVLLAKQQKKL